MGRGELLLPEGLMAALAHLAQSLQREEGTWAPQTLRVPLGLGAGFCLLVGGSSSKEARLSLGAE